MRSKILSSLFLSFCSFNPVSAQDAATSLSFNADLILGAVPISRLGGERVVIYEEAGNDNRFFYPPVILPEWGEFFAAVDEECAARDSTSTVFEDLEIYISDDEYLDDLKSKVASESGVDAGSVRLLAIPYRNIEIYLTEDSGLRARTLYRFTEDSSPGNYTLNRVYESRLQAEISVSCSDVEKFKDRVYKDKNVVEGRVYADGLRYDDSAFYAHASTVFGSDDRSNIFGEESLVRVSNFETTATARPSILNLAMSFALNESVRPDVSEATKAARSSRQRILTRDYVRSLARQSLFSLTGACVGTDDAFCDTQENRLLNWILNRFDTIDLAIQKQEDGSARLVADQIAYATLTPQQYKTLARAAPSFQSQSQSSDSGRSVGGTLSAERSETAQSTVSNDVTWDVSGAEPIPTNVNMVIVDEARLNVEIDVEWRRRRPIEASSGMYLIRMVYPSLNYKSGSICGIQAFEDRETVRKLCANGNNVVAVANRTREESDRSSRCRTIFDFTWSARSGHYFKARSSPVSKEQWGSASKRSFNHDPTAHDKDVKKDGKPQMWKSYRVHGHSNNSTSSTGRRKSCGTEATFNARMYPLYCAYFEVDGYEAKHGTPPCGYFSDVLRESRE